MKNKNWVEWVKEHKAECEICRAVTEEDAVVAHGQAVPKRCLTDIYGALLPSYPHSHYAENDLTKGNINMIYGHATET